MVVNINTADLRTHIMRYSACYWQYAAVLLPSKLKLGAELHV